MEKEKQTCKTKQLRSQVDWIVVILNARLLLLINNSFDVDLYFIIMIYITCSSCLQIARAFGASDIIAVDIHDEKLQKAKVFGASHTVNALKEDVAEKIRVLTLSASLGL